VTPVAFPNRVRNLAAVLLSAAALLAIAAYLTAPVSAKPKLTTSYSASDHPMVVGTIEASSPAALRRARVKLLFWDGRHRAVGVKRPSPDSQGKWRARIPSRARSVTIVVREEGQVVKQTDPIRPGQSLKVAEVLPGNGGALLPGLFPY